jgi:hypothetical protein
LVAAYRRFKELEPKGPIRHGLYGTLPLHDRTMESSVLSMFLALESLTLFFRRQNDLEFILPEGEWEEFERELRAWIKAQQHLRDKPVDRSLVYGKIKELNRPPFTAVFERFVEKYQIDISDLWPVTGKGSLLELRNRIVHGEVFSQLQAWALSSATQHLQWLLERIVLTILGWPIEQSRVSAQALKFMCAYVDWKEDRKAFL